MFLMTFLELPCERSWLVLGVESLGLRVLMGICVSTRTESECFLGFSSMNTDLMLIDLKLSMNVEFFLFGWPSARNGNSCYIDCLLLGRLMTEP